MNAAARFFTSRSGETRLKILCLLSGTEELCVCDIIDVGQNAEIQADEVAAGIA
jgi:hypothetical protein